MKRLSTPATLLLGMLFPIVVFAIIVGMGTLILWGSGTL